MRVRLGLRVRGALALAMLGLIAASAMGLLTYQLARRYLTVQREDLAVRQAAVNAGVAKAILEGPDSAPRDALSALAVAEPGRPLLLVEGEWYSAAVEIGPEQVPERLLELVQTGSSAQQRVDIGEAPYLVVGIPLPSVGSAYFELSPLRELDRTLRVLTGSLAAAAALTAVLTALSGWSMSRRVLSPLRDVSAAAEQLSAGSLDTRLDAADDPDLEPLALSFNRMAEALQERVAREIRFTSDVSHELRTPLTAISSAADLARRTEMPERARLAIGVLGSQVDHFRALVLDLLEISRYDAGDVPFDPDDVDVEAFVREQLALLGVEAPTVTVGTRTGMVAVDRRRLERIVANLVENANRYAGGPTRIEISGDRDVVRIAVEDAGPGVPEAERRAVFGRFNRGSAEANPSMTKGTGLGLALVEQHVRLHGGSIWIEDAVGGGARFVVELPRRRA
ncbi:MAG: ATP-binding protein [Acidimicrobiia bacterium]